MAETKNPMDFRDRYIHNLLRKGKSGLNNLDKLLLLANPRLKQEIETLFTIQEQKVFASARERLAQSLEPYSGQKQSGENFSFKSLPGSVRWTPVAAALLAFCLSLLLNFLMPTGTLGGSVNLFVAAADMPERFLYNGQGVAAGTSLQLSWLTDARPYRQGIIGAVQAGEIQICYRFDAGYSELNQIRRTLVPEQVILKPATQVIYFFAVFTTGKLNELGITRSLQELLAQQPFPGDRDLNRVFVNNPFTFIWLKQEPSL